MRRRRSLLKGAAAARTAAASGASFNCVHANCGTNKLIHRPHAQRVSKQAGVDGLIPLNPVNVFYLGDSLGYNVETQTRKPSLALHPRDNLASRVKHDLVLQENRTLSVDFRYLEIGWGNCDLEDLVRITRDGAESLATIDSPLVAV